MITSGEDAALRALTERTDGQYAVSTTESALTASLDQIEGREERHRHDSEDRGARLVTLRQALTATGAHRRSALARWGGQ
ncbi:MAG: hypothetical protein SV966_03645 [Actinomycetota bacterium]|nr:hypothetical protein [Actinomycetota bacterium]